MQVSESAILQSWYSSPGQAVISSADNQVNRQIDRQIDRQTDNQVSKQIDRHYKRSIALNPTNQVFLEWKKQAYIFIYIFRPISVVLFSRIIARQVIGRYRGWSWRPARYRFRGYTLCLHVCLNVGCWGHNFFSHTKNNIWPLGG